MTRDRLSRLSSFSSTVLQRGKQATFRRESCAASTLIISIHHRLSALSQSFAFFVFFIFCSCINNPFYPVSWTVFGPSPTNPSDHHFAPYQLVIMDTLVARYTQSPFANEGYTTEDQNDLYDTVPSLSLRFALPPVPRPSAFLRAATDDFSNPNCPIKIAHGTTTLAFRFKGGIIVATDSRATAGNWIASQTVKKVIEINPMLLGTMAGGAAVRIFLAAASKETLI